MHKIHKESNTASSPETTGATIHWTSQYDFFAGLVGLGVNGRNSRMVVEMAGIKTGDKILDVGCGTGDLTLAAAKSAGSPGYACGIDAAPEGIEIARKKASRTGFGAVFEIGLIEKIPYPDAGFDIVISRLVIHHLPDDLKRRGFAEIFRVLRPGGRLFLVDFKPPANHFLSHLSSALVGHRMMQASRIWELPPLLEGVGFVDIDSGPTRSTFMAFVSGKKPAG